MTHNSSPVPKYLQPELQLRVWTCVVPLRHQRTYGGCRCNDLSARRMYHTRGNMSTPQDLRGLVMSTRHGGDISPPCQPIAPEPGRWSRAAKRPGLTLDRRPRSGAPRRRSGGTPTPRDRRGAGGRRKRGAAPPRPPGGSRAGRAKPDRAAARRREGGPDGGRAGARTRGARSGAEGKAQPSPEQLKGDPGQAPSPPGAEPGRAAARPAARTAGGRSRPRGGRGPAR